MRGADTRGHPAVCTFPFSLACFCFSSFLVSVALDVAPRLWLRVTRSCHRDAGRPVRYAGADSGLGVRGAKGWACWPVATLTCQGPSRVAPPWRDADGCWAQCQAGPARRAGPLSPPDTRFLAEPVSPEPGGGQGEAVTEGCRGGGCPRRAREAGLLLTPPAAFPAGHGCTGLRTPGPEPGGVQAALTRRVRPADQVCGTGTRVLGGSAAASATAGPHSPGPDLGWGEGPGPWGWREAGGWQGGSGLRAVGAQSRVHATLALRTDSADMAGPSLGRCGALGPPALMSWESGSGLSYCIYEMERMLGGSFASKV